MLALTLFISPVYFDLSRRLFLRFLPRFFLEPFAILNLLDVSRITNASQRYTRTEKTPEQISHGFDPNKQTHSRVWADSLLYRPDGKNGFDGL